MARKTAFSLVFIIVAVLTMNFASLIFEGEQGRFRRFIRKNGRFVEKEDLLALSGNVSQDYYDQLGNDKRSLLFIASNFFRRCDDISVSLGSPEVSFENEKAIARIEATVYWREGPSAELLYDTVRVEAVFRKAKRTWKLVELEFLDPEDKRLLNPMVALAEGSLNGFGEPAWKSL